jgi:hypothetical protein
VSMRSMTITHSTLLNQCTTESLTSGSTTSEFANEFIIKFYSFQCFSRTVISPSVQNESLRTLNPNFKGVVFAYMGQALLWNKQTAKNYSLKFCSERFLLNQRVFYFPKDFYLVEEFNHQISVLSANGILTKILSEFVDQSFLSVKSENAGPSPISLKQISGIFYISAVGLLFSLLVFATEVLSNHLQKLHKFSFLE